MWMLPLYLHVNQKSDYDYDKYSDWLTIRSGHGILMYLAGQGFSVRKLSHNFPLTANSLNNQLTYKDQVLEDGIVRHFYSEELVITKT